MDERYLKHQGKMARPIPGMSLTNDPNSPAPFEGAPEFTKKKEALEAIFSGLIEEATYVQLIESLANGIPVISVVQVLLYEGFKQGKWNPDLFLLLIEPTAYIVMALAERAGVEYVIDNDEDDEDDDMSAVQNQFDSVKKSLSKGKPGVVPKEIAKKIEEMPPMESLLAKPKAEQPVEDVESLITRP
jgi:hypothetical protein